MINSIKYSYLVLRVGLAAVFLWYGIDKFIHPEFWLHTWVPAFAVSAMTKVGVVGVQFIYLAGIFELLVALSLITGVFIRFFSLCAALFLMAALISNKFNETLIRDIGLCGGLLAILLWSDRQR